MIITGLADLKQIEHLLELSKYGIAFHGDTKREVGSLMKELHALSSFEFFMKIMHILKALSGSPDFELLHKSPYKHKFRKKEQKRLNTIHAYIDEHYHRKISIGEVAQIANLTRPAFCRYFKKATGSTFTAFLNQYRVSHAQRMLHKGSNVSETCFSCGFESLSYFNRIFKKVAGENPSAFKKRMAQNL